MDKNIYKNKIYYYTDSFFLLEYIWLNKSQKNARATYFYNRLLFFLRKTRDSIGKKIDKKFHKEKKEEEEDYAKNKISGHRIYHYDGYRYGVCPCGI